MAGYQALCAEVLEGMTAALALYRRFGFGPTESYAREPAPNGSWPLAADSCGSAPNAMAHGVLGKKRMVSYRRLFELAGRWCAGRDSMECVATKARLAAAPSAAWQVLLTYEEVKHQPPWLLRWLLPRPLGTKGDKTQVGTDIPCQYEGGELTKRILISDAPRHLEFEVVGQHLGIEQCLTALGGSYDIQAAGEQSEIELTTRYIARLRPRWFWRPIEQFLAHAFHRHILKGMAASLQQPAEFHEGVCGCPTSPSASHR